MLIRTLFLCLGILFTVAAKASDTPPSIKSGVPYDQARASLIADEWQPIINSKISLSSLYAHEIFEQGYTEVVDCISMELDACTFRYVKNHKTLEIRTITRALKVDKVNLIKK